MEIKFSSKLIFVRKGPICRFTLSQSVRAIVVGQLIKSTQCWKFASFFSKLTMMASILKYFCKLTVWESSLVLILTCNQQWWHWYWNFRKFTVWKTPLVLIVTCKIKKDSAKMRNSRANRPFHVQTSVIMISGAELIIYCPNSKLVLHLAIFHSEFCHESREIVSKLFGIKNFYV